MGESKLAIHGGEKVISDDLIKPWPPIDKIDQKMVINSLNGTKHWFGPNCEAFEKEFGAWNDNKFVITTNSGTAALHMAIFACGCGVGDEIVVPAYSWSSSATCILHHNCIPVFVDIDYDTMNIDTAKIEAAITEKTKAIIVVHLHGLMVNMEKILLIAKKYNLKVIEDACQAHGAEFENKKAGQWGDCAAFSCNQNKLLSSGEGGLFVTNNEEIYKKALMLWSFGETRTPDQSRDYHVYALGWMYRNNDLTAAFGRAQLTKLDSYLRAQERNAQVLKEELSGVKGLVLPLVPQGHKHNWYNFVIRIDTKSFGYNGDPVKFREILMNAILAEGAPVGVWQRFILPAMTVFQAKNAYGKGCPWDCQYYNKKATYDPDDFPNAQKHCDSHFIISDALRTPNDETVAKKIGIAIKKIIDNIDQLEID